jgi:hypothetical protein
VFTNSRAPSLILPKSGPAVGALGGRTWWAHLKITRINIELTILYKKIEDLLELL